MRLGNHSWWEGPDGVCCTNFKEASLSHESEWWQTQDFIVDPITCFMTVTVMGAFCDILQLCRAETWDGVFLTAYQPHVVVGYFKLQQSKSKTQLGYIDLWWHTSLYSMSGNENMMYGESMKGCTLLCLPGLLRPFTLCYSWLYFTRALHTSHWLVVPQGISTVTCQFNFSKDVITEWSQGIRKLCCMWTKSAEIRGWVADGCFTERDNWLLHLL